MSISTLRKIYIVILVAVVVIMVIGIVQDPSDHKLLVKGAGLLIACIVAIVKLESRYSAAAARKLMNCNIRILSVMLLQRTNLRKSS